MSQLAKYIFAKCWANNYFIMCFDTSVNPLCCVCCPNASANANCVQWCYTMTKSTVLCSKCDDAMYQDINSIYTKHISVIVPFMLLSMREVVGPDVARLIIGNLTTITRIVKYFA